jgi:hypothetical protein
LIFHFNFFEKRLYAVFDDDVGSCSSGGGGGTLTTISTADSIGNTPDAGNSKGANMISPTD